MYDKAIVPLIIIPLVTKQHLERVLQQPSPCPKKDEQTVISLIGRPSLYWTRHPKHKSPPNLRPDSRLARQAQERHPQGAERPHPFHQGLYPLREPEQAIVLEGADCVYLPGEEGAVVHEVRRDPYIANPDHQRVQGMLLWLLLIEILIDRQVPDPLVNRQETLHLHELDQRNRNLPDPWLPDLQHHSGPDGGPCDHIKRADVWAVGDWGAYSAEWEDWSVYEETDQWGAVSVYCGQEGHWGLLGEKSVGVLVQWGGDGDGCGVLIDVGRESREEWGERKRRG